MDALIEQHEIGTTRTYQCTNVNAKVGLFVNVFRVDERKGYIARGRNKTPVCLNGDYVCRGPLTRGDYDSAGRIYLLPLALSD
jgi:hypothetical protein